MLTRQIALTDCLTADDGRQISAIHFYELSWLWEAGDSEPKPIRIMLFASRLVTGMLGFRKKIYPKYCFCSNGTWFPDQERSPLEFRSWIKLGLDSTEHRKSDSILFNVCRDSEPLNSYTFFCSKGNAHVSPTDGSQEREGRIYDLVRTSRKLGKAWVSNRTTHIRLHLDSFCKSRSNFSLVSWSFLVISERKPQMQVTLSESGSEHPKFIRYSK